jgi:site-specific DNA recombinase
LLQGLTVCGHCHYAYYGKTVGKAAAKGRRQYAYYRCIGTDAYRFGGERICDNKQVRTERLDDVVWHQVVELLADPARLKNEYNRRLEVIENNEKDNLDIEVLKKQQRHIEKGKSRLIDSYAEGIIDKVDFDPKIKQLKVKLERLARQIDESSRHQEGQGELLLLIDRLDEFSVAVKDRLSSIDFTTKREIIRALVKRIEIHKDEIVVVFRVDPDPGFNIRNGSLDPQTERSMQDRTRRNFPRPCQYLPP